MIKTYENSDPEKVDDMVNNHKPKPWATQTSVYVLNGTPVHKAVVFYGER